MEMDGLDARQLYGAPPLMPWESFVDWIGMSDEPRVVRSWIDRGYIPSVKVGRRVMVNVVALTRDLLEKESQ